MTTLQILVTFDEILDKVIDYILMKIDNELILKLENLARLALNDQERIQITKDLENILGMVEKLQELDTQGVEPLKHLTKYHMSAREDIPQDNSNTEMLLDQAPQKINEYIVIPKVINKD